MLYDIIFNEITYWLLGTALVFTFVGFYFARQDSINVVEGTIDSLINQGYLRTRGEGKNLEVLKYWDEDDQTIRNRH